MTRRRVNFVHLIGEIRDAGLSQDDIAQRCRCTRQAISLIERDPRRDPSYSIGAALVALHARVMARTTDQLSQVQADSRQHQPTVSASGSPVPAPFEDGSAAP